MRDYGKDFATTFSDGKCTIQFNVVHPVKNCILKLSARQFLKKFLRNSRPLQWQRRLSVTIVACAKTGSASAVINGLFESLFLLVLRKVVLSSCVIPNSPEFSYTFIGK
jgi:hypothetical protein